MKYTIGSIGYVLRTLAGLNSAFIFGLSRVLKPLLHADATMRQFDTSENIKNFS